MRAITLITLILFAGLAVSSAQQAGNSQERPRRFQQAVPEPTDTNAPPVRQVEVVNFPDPQNIAGTVEVSNLPTSQIVTGTVSIDNLPAVIQVEIVNPQATSHYRLIDFTNSTFNGGQGIFTYHAACAAEFADSRMCAIEEVLKSTDVPSNLPTGPDARAWVDPSLPANTILNCDGWFRDTGSTWRGQTVNELGQFVTVGCNSVLPVACCAP